MMENNFLAKKGTIAKTSVRTRALAVLTAAVVLAGTAVPSFAVPLAEVQKGFAKNVIIMIPDGMSHSGVTLTRWVYNDGKPLNMDEIASGLMTTHNSDTVIADSAPAGTAMATGYKTQDKLIGVKPTAATLPGARPVVAGEELAPVASIVEAAKLAGKSVGVVATSEIQHATPADFTSHAAHRSLYTTIGEQQVYQNLDVVMGGGADYLLVDPKQSSDPKSKMRIDNEDMQDAIKSLGYTFATTRTEMLKAKSGKFWGAFAPTAMSRDIAKGAEEPSIAEMTAKSIELLSKNKNGFMLMVEGSQVDWAAHGNQTVGVISEIRAFDKAVGEALKFAKSNKDTLVIVATDHGNGGISIGDASTSSTYPEHPMSHFTSVLKQAILSEEEAAKKVNEARTNFREVVGTLGIVDLTADEEKALVAAKGVDENGKAFDNTLKLLTAMVNKRAHIGWTTGGHTGEDVVLYTYANGYQNRLSGTVQNAEIALYAAKALNLDLDMATKSLFVSQTALAKMGFTVTLDDSEPANIVLEVEKKGISFRFPENKNHFLQSGFVKSYNGINVYNGKQFFVPQAAVDMMNKLAK